MERAEKKFQKNLVKWKDKGEMRLKIFNNRNKRKKNDEKRGETKKERIGQIQKITTKWYIKCIKLQYWLMISNENGKRATKIDKSEKQIQDDVEIFRSLEDLVERDA